MRTLWYGFYLDRLALHARRAVATAGLGIVLVVGAALVFAVALAIIVWGAMGGGQ